MKTANMGNIPNLSRTPARVAFQKPPYSKIIHSYLKKIVGHQTKIKVADPI